MIIYEDPLIELIRKITKLFQIIINVNLNEKEPET